MNTDEKLLQQLRMALTAIKEAQGIAQEGEGDPGFYKDLGYRAHHSLSTIEGQIYTLQAALEKKLDGNPLYGEAL